ncbi:MAG: alpha/beta fold hydrolase, partial [Candidatus Cryptobacteroides sp.]
TFTLRSAFDDLNLSVAVIEPETTSPKGIFQISHGMAEHKERYYPFMEFLAANGYVCVIHDHRGHGASVKGPDDLGYMYKGGAEALVEDLKMVQDSLKADYPGLECTLFGHSMGSMVVRAFCRKYDGCISRLIVCGCPSDNPAKSAGLALARTVGFFCGGHHRSGLINAIAFGSYNKNFPKEEGSLAWLSANRENVAEYERDPLCGYCFTANGFANLFRIMQMCYDPDGWKMSNPQLPIRFFSGADDPCRISDKAFGNAAGFLRGRGYTDVTTRLYPGLRHEILLEGDRQVWNDMLDFIIISGN